VDAPSPAPEKLWFVNLGAYDDTFTELHAIGFYVAASAPEAKAQALARHANDRISEIHKDDLHAIDDCIALEAVSGMYITLAHTEEASTARPNNGYHIVPKDIIQEYLKRESD
jgi:hypothetical protein